MFEGFNESTMEQNGLLDMEKNYERKNMVSSLPDH